MELLHYAEYARAHAVFYEHPSRRPPSGDVRLRPAHARDWSTWRGGENDGWVFWQPAAVELPEQGWKIHVSGTPDNASEVLRLVSEWCHDHALTFKHLPDRAAVVRRNAKDADRSAAGKFMTLYPRDEPELHTALQELGALLHGLEGPLVLSDLRWADGLLSVRYGAFAHLRTRDEDGREVFALRSPDGALVEDRREPEFTPPDWITLPAFLRQEEERLGDGSTPHAFPYTVLRPLGYSNAGGVYAATDSTGRAVVLKEARPHAGLTPDGRDAIARSRDEEARLRMLAGPGIVSLRDVVELFGHRFLVLDHVDGESLNRAMVSRSPIVRSAVTPGDYLDYRQWALDICRQLDAVVARIHAAGFTHGDLHPGNVIVGPGGDVTVIDLELSRPLSDTSPVVTGAPGFVAPDGRAGIAADAYALACIKLSLFLPLTTLLPLDPAAAERLLDEARDLFALDDDWTDRVRVPLRRRAPRAPSLLAQTAASAARDWKIDREEDVFALQVLLARPFVAVADFSRADRAWPGDPRLFAENGFGIAHGAAGVIHALDTAALAVDPLSLLWLEHAVMDAVVEDRPELGLYDGLAGAALVLRRCGNAVLANEVRARLRAIDHDDVGSDLYGGLAGIGLWLLAEVDTADSALLDDARQIANTLRIRLDAVPAPTDATPIAPTGRGGLMWGWSGAALFAIRLYEHTHSPAHLRLAIDALQHDLARCIIADDGSLQVNEGWRVVPTLASGSAGIGLVIAQLLPHVSDPERWRATLTQITRASYAGFMIEPGLFDGRAGIILYLNALGRLGLATVESENALIHHTRALRLHAIPHGVGIGFPGHKLLRLSCDFATGSAGVITALQAYTSTAHNGRRSDWDQLLPLLLPATSPHAPTTETSGR
jgi:tRNA A-37 threonylcarbamoyl transferase component Bud32